MAQVGPSGQVASAFQQLGQEAGKNGRFAEYARGTFFTQQTGDVFEGASIMLSMLFMGLSFMWFMVAMYAIVDMGFVKGRPKYTLYVQPALSLSVFWTSFSTAQMGASMLTCCKGRGGLWCSP